MLLHPGPARPRGRVGDPLQLVNVDQLVSGLPELRAAVARGAASLNSLHRGSVVVEDGEALCTGGGLVVRLERVEARARSVAWEARVDWCSPSSWLHAYMGLLEALERELTGWLGLEEPVARELLSFAGLYRLHLESGGRPVVADTSLVYHGVHNLCWEGAARLELPYCAKAEVLWNYYEAKPGRERPYMDELAYQALEDLEQCGAPTVPSPPPPCNTAIPSMDPLLLRDKLLATLDHRAHMLWREHPVSRIAKPIETRLERHQEPDTTTMARIAYAILQLRYILQKLVPYTKPRRLALRVEPQQPPGQ